MPTFYLKQSADRLIFGNKAEISSHNRHYIGKAKGNLVDDQHNGIGIEVNVYKRAGRWTGQYILTKQLDGYTLNEVNLLSEAGQTEDEARELALCEARRTIDRFLRTTPLLIQQLARATRA